jgi:hypothetical protein
MMAQNEFGRKFSWPEIQVKEPRKTIITFVKITGPHHIHARYLLKVMCVTAVLMSVNNFIDVQN